MSLKITVIFKLFAEERQAWCNTYDLRKRINNFSLLACKNIHFVDLFLVLGRNLWEKPNIFQEIFEAGALFGEWWKWITTDYKFIFMDINKIIYRKLTRCEMHDKSRSLHYNINSLIVRIRKEITIRS